MPVCFLVTATVVLDVIIVVGIFSETYITGLIAS